MTTKYVWDEFSAYGDVVLEANSANVPQTHYTLANGKLISQTLNGNTEYFLTDAQGSTRTLVDQTGTVSAQFAYDAFGNLTDTSGPLSRSAPAGSAAPIAGRSSS